MKALHTVQGKIERLQQAWATLDASHRRLAAGVCLVALAIGGVAWFQSQRNEARMLERALASLARQEAAFNVEAREAKALQAMPAGAQATTEADLAAIQSLAGEGVSVTAVPGGGYRLMSASVPYARWWALCDELDRRHGLTMSALEWAPKQDVKDNVSFDMTVSVATGARAP
ncbi:MAG: type II secretion system protein M [Betaproteobacteria bacterium]|nr:type II secretion system protein M [Betaproteobacteria bacterium]